METCIADDSVYLAYSHHVSPPGELGSPAGPASLGGGSKRHSPLYGFRIPASCMRERASLTQGINVEWLCTDLSFPSIVKCIISHEEDNLSESSIYT